MHDRLCLWSGLVRSMKFLKSVLSILEEYLTKIVEVLLCQDLVHCRSVGVYSYCKLSLSLVNYVHIEFNLSISGSLQSEQTK